MVRALKRIDWKSGTGQGERRSGDRPKCRHCDTEGDLYETIGEDRKVGCLRCLLNDENDPIPAVADYSHSLSNTGYKRIVTILSRPDCLHSSGDKRAGEWRKERSL